jgi:hypothetical protein
MSAEKRTTRAQRDAVADQLQEAYGVGVLDDGEISERLDAAMAAKYPSELAQLTSDLPDRPVEVKRRRRPGTRQVVALIAFLAVLGLALGLVAGLGGSSHPAPAANPALQLVQTLRQNGVPVANVIPDPGLSASPGATSGVEATTAPGDSAAQYGSSPQDTEIDTYKNHAQAAAGAGELTGQYRDQAPGADADYRVILGADWEAVVPTPAAPRILAVLGGTIVPYQVIDN